MTPRVLATSLLLLLLPLSALPIGGALPGDGGGFTGTRLEGESYDISSTYCDSFDGEQAHAADWGDASNGRYAFLPGTYCGIEFTSIAFPGYGRFTTAHVIVQAPSGTTGELRLDVAVDGEVVATVPFSFSDTNRIQLLTLSAIDVLNGTRTVTLTYSGSPSWVNLGIDYVDYEVSAEPPCVNQPPKVLLSADGMVNGLVGWVGHTYLFTAAASDADGDALEFTWTAGNATLVTGTTLTWGSPVVGAHVVQVAAREQVDRCGTGPLTTTTSVTFLVRPDWEIQLTQPSAGTGCVETFRIPARLVAGYCDFVAAVDAGAEAPAFRFDGRFLLDGENVSAHTDPTFSYRYDSLSYRGGEHQVRACVQEPTDRYARVFCTDSYVFTSVGWI